MAKNQNVLSTNGLTTSSIIGASTISKIQQQKACFHILKMQTITCVREGFTLYQRCMLYDLRYTNNQIPFYLRKQTVIFILNCIYL